MSDAPFVSVVIPHLNQTVLPHDVVAQFPNVRLLSETEPGPGPARNKGVAEAKGEIIAFTDADCVIDPGWLACIVSYFSENPDAHAVGGDVYILRGDPDHATPLEAYEGVYAFRTRMYIEKMNFTATNNMAVRAKTMAEVGVFGGKDIAEDRDWGHRAHAMGYPVRWTPGMVIHHPARSNFGELCKKWDRHTSHDYTSIHAKSGGKIRWLLRAGALAVSPIPEIPRILRAKRISGFRERALAFWVLVKIRLYRAGIMLKMAVSKDTVKRMSGAWNA